MNEARDILKKATGLVDSIAGDVWPNGARLVCKVCGHEIAATSADCGYYLGHGWPEHCGQTMILESNEEERCQH